MTFLQLSKNNQEDAFMTALAFVCQGFLWEYVFFLLKRYPYLFIFFFFEQAVAFYNFACLLQRNSFSTSYTRSVQVGVIWKPTKRSWGKKVPVFKLEPSKHFFSGVFVSAVALEVYFYKGIPLFIFGPEFFYVQPRKKVYYLMNRIWWFSVDLLLFTQSYVFHLAVARYNHYVEGIFAGAKPLLRGVTTWKVRLLEPRRRVLDFQLLMWEYYEILLYFSRFVFYVARGRDYDDNYTKGSSFVAKEAFIAEDAKECFGWSKASTFFGGLFSRHFFGLAFPVWYFSSFNFWGFSVIYYMYFVYRYIQRSPKKFTFTKSWVSLWMSLPVMGGLWVTIQREMIERFWKGLMEQYLALVLTSKGYVNSSLLEVLTYVDFSDRRWFAFVPSHFFDITFLDYERAYWVEANIDFARAFGQWAKVLEHWRSIPLDDFAPDPAQLRALAWTFDLALEFLVGHFFSFTDIRDVLPFSYTIFIFWKSNSMFLFTARFSKIESLISYFKRLNLDDFFFSRLCSFLEFFQGQTFLLRALASYGNETEVAQRFLQEGQKLSLILGKSFFRESEAGAEPLAHFLSPLTLKMRILFYFHLKDLVFKHLYWSKLMSFYLFFFSLFFCSLKKRRFFSFAFSIKHGRDFKVYLLNFIGRFYAPPLGQEPISFYDSRYSEGVLQRFYASDAVFRSSLAVQSIGKRRGVFWAKWYPLFSALEATGVSVAYSLEPMVDESNWEIAYKGLPLLLPWVTSTLDQEISAGILEMQWSFYYMVFGK